MHFEKDGGTYHRDTIFSNHIVYLDLLLIENMDNLVVCGCPGLLYLNTCERSMLLLSIGLSSLELSLDVGKDERLTTEIISRAI